jgi:oligopeptide/dipeptide ABC transporter ATP-binding protein
VNGARRPRPARPLFRHPVTDTPLLEIQDLKTEFRLVTGRIRAVNGVSFTLDRGTTLGVVGESGSGKSVTALSLMRLVDKPYGHIVSGKVIFRDADAAQDLLALPPAGLEAIRGNKISMIFQDPMTSLNPVLTIGFQLAEPLKLHRGMGEREARARAADLLAQVGIPEVAHRLREYPHQFSGGMRQRVMIAMAIACSPRLLIADEPTSSLDVTIQAQILELMNGLKAKNGTAIIFITHDLGVIAEMADHVAVMYAGTVVEKAPVAELFGSPLHPYTRALLKSIPGLRNRPRRLTTIEGQPPLLDRDITGCPFRPRCAEAIGRCATDWPPLIELAPRHATACWVAAGKAGRDG